MMNRAYWLLDLKSFDDDKRSFSGIASTPSVDRMGDIVEPEGAKYDLPIPLMWQHGSDDIKHPVGWVEKVSVKKNAIHVEGRFAKLQEPPTLKEALDKAWALVKSKLVPGLSIGFNPIESEPIKNSYGRRFTSWEWLELSPVAIAANQDSMLTTFKSMDEFNANITVKSHDRKTYPLSGNDASSVVWLDTTTNRPGVPGSPKGTPMKTINEHIASLEERKGVNEKTLDAIMQKCADEGRTRDDAEQQQYDGIAMDNEKLDADIKAFRQREESLKRTAVPVAKSVPSSDFAASQQRSGVQYVRSNAPKGIFVARMVIAMHKAGNNPMYAAELCQKHWPDMPELAMNFKAIVEAGDTTTSGWASQLVPAAQQLQGDFLDMFRAATIIDKIPGKTDVPFNVAVPIRLTGGTAAWVGEAAPKPVSGETFTNVTLRFEKAAFIIPISQELARFSSPSAELVIRNSMIKTMATFFDTHFVSATAAVSNVSPAGILNGISGVAATGTTMAHAQADLAALIGRFTANGVPLDQVVLMLSSGMAAKLGLARTSLGVRIFDGISRTGGELESFPAIVSETVGNKIIGLYAPDLLLAEDPAVDITTSTEATIEMDTAPAIGEQSPPSTQSVLKSAFQYNLLLIRAEQFRTWKIARAASVEYISGVAYVPGT